MKAKQKHILILSAWYPTEEDPMFGLFVRNYAEMLTSDYQVSVIFYNTKVAKGRKKSISISVRNNVNEIGVHYYSSNKFIRLLGMIIGMHKAFKLLKKRFGKPDLVHVQILTRMAVFARIIQIRFGIPYVVTEHWSRYLPENQSYKGWLRKIITSYVCKKAAAMSAVSQYLANATQNAGLKHREPYHILYNVVDTSIFTPRKDTSGREVKQILHVSCFENKSKNLIGMLDALLQLRMKRTDFQCVMAGTGDDFEMIRDYAASKNMLDYIEFTGLITVEAVANLMQNSDLYLQTSHYETLSIVIAEALCCGLPVVSTAVGAIPEIVNNNNGMLVSDNDLNELVLAIDLMLNQCHNFDSKEISKNAVNLFSVKAIEKRFIGFYNQASKKIEY